MNYQLITGCLLSRKTPVLLNGSAALLGARGKATFVMRFFYPQSGAVPPLSERSEGNGGTAKRERGKGASDRASCAEWSTPNGARRTADLEQCTVLLLREGRARIRACRADRAPQTAETPARPPSRGKGGGAPTEERPRRPPAPRNGDKADGRRQRARSADLPDKGRCVEGGRA